MKASDYLAKSSSENQSTAKQVYDKIELHLQGISSRPPIKLGKEIHNMITQLPGEVLSELSQMLSLDGWELVRPWEGSRDDGRNGDYVLKIKN